MVSPLRPIVDLGRACESFRLGGVDVLALDAGALLGVRDLCRDALLAAFELRWAVESELCRRAVDG